MFLVIKFIYNIYISIFYRIKITGKENIPTTGAAIICPNHIHALDSTFIMAKTKRRIKVLVKEELMRNKFTNWVGKKLGGYPIKRDSADLGAAKVALKILKEEQLLMIFPEGTRNGLKKGVQPKNGAINIAIRTNVPIIPVKVEGKFKLFSKVTIKIGKAIYYDAYKGKVADKDFVTELTNRLMQTILSLE